MSPKVRNLMIVLATAAAVCVAMFGFDSHRARGPAVEHQPDTNRPIAQSANSPVDAAGRSKPTADSSVQSAIERAPKFSAESPQNQIYELKSQLRASEQKLKELLRELEEALARLPADDGETEATGEIAAFESLRRAELKAGADYRSLMESAEQFIEQYPRSPLAEEAKTLFEKYARAWDEHEFQAASEFSQSNPQSFDAQLARFQTYIDHHGAAGKSVTEADAAISKIRADWAEHDYSQIYDFATRYPSDLAAVATRVRRHLDEHPTTRHRAMAEQFLARYEKAATPREYRLRVKSGSFAHSVGRALSNGPDLAVEIEVAGVRVGRTPIVADSYEPVWNYEFPQSVRWRLGDPVRIRVIDFDYSNRTILKIEPPADDPLALRFLAGTITAEGHKLVFESDFQAPTLSSPSGN